MSTPFINYALDRMAEVQAALAAVPELADVHVTLDVLEVPSAARNGVVVVSPPKTRPVSHYQVEVDQTLAILAGPVDNPLQAWQRIDAIYDALLAGGVNVADSEPDTFTPPHGPALSGYAVTLTTDVVSRD